MKNIPRIFIGDNIQTGQQVTVEKSVIHYLTRVMRTNRCLVFGGGHEFTAHVSVDNKSLVVDEKTSHMDPSNDITLMFAPVKRTDDLLNMATQLGVARFQPVITDRTVAKHINWERMKKIVIESSEQSNRNSVPEILSPKKFTDIDFSDIAFADERAAYGRCTKSCNDKIKTVLVGPEGGFSESEFEKLDSAGACGISLGKTILRAELAAAIAISKLVD